MELTESEKELLLQAQEIVSTVETSGWNKYLVPYMVSLIEWPNPKEAKNIDELLLPYTEAYGMAEAIKKINSFIEQNRSMLSDLTKKQKGEDDVPTFAI